jgi:hypothetical membrane protein
MDIFLRIIAIVIEVLILAALFFAVAWGFKLVIADFGVKAKYNIIINLALITVGAIFIAFCIAHLTTFYPPT